MFEGLTVLNFTEGSEAIGWLIVLAVFIFIIGVILAAVADSPALLIVAIIVALIPLANGVPTEPRYEVTLAPGAVIDATQWKIVEQRGDIYVLEPKVDVEVSD